MTGWVLSGEEFFAETFQAIYLNHGLDIPAILGWMSLASAIAFCGVMFVGE